MHSFVVGACMITFVASKHIYIYKAPSWYGGNILRQGQGRIQQEHSLATSWSTATQSRNRAQSECQIRGGIPGTNIHTLCLRVETHFVAEQNLISRAILSGFVFASLQSFIIFKLSETNKISTKTHAVKGRVSVEDPLSTNARPVNRPPLVHC